MYNYAEFFQRTAVLLWSLTSNKQGGGLFRTARPIPRATTLVLSPSLNLPLQPYHKLLLQPFSDMQVIAPADGVLLHTGWLSKKQLAISMLLQFRV